ncbi:sugar transferase [Actinocatenispora rupis]|uniref:Bacterial sugar transferase domain-containing protein n=1 Tax=Actinocatenispora rupis TaxID=519421 RepID=A0A8J3J3I4_9ACTN|nr:sugar transferase [Actinocatenispora rupis]GID09474.1 hypothetical protein Aru02nite_03630 [Actinocatenispora rupis]
MYLWLFAGPAALSAVLTAGTRRLPRAALGADRLAVLVAVLVSAPLAWWRAGPVAALLLVPVAGFAGGLVATALRTGLIEYNTAPGRAVREKVLAYHLDVRRRPPQPAKRAFDVVVATIGLALTLPLWPVIAALVWLAEPGPVLFIKYSVGQGGVTFRQVKFRSMRYRAEQSTGPIASPAHDGRVLAVGTWLRRWHLDEISELLNVLQGSMSLVGPRPLRTVLVQYDLEQLPGFAERHSVRPGIACIAQIQKYNLSVHERLRKDRTYIRCMCLGLDVRLLWMAAVTTARGSRRA